MFRFTPKTDEEIAALMSPGLLDAGEYPFTIKDIISRDSAKGNPMLEVTLAVMDKDGSTRMVKDYLLQSDKMLFKLKHFCDGIGLGEKFAKGELNPADCLKRSGMVKLGTDKGKLKPDGEGMWPDKNIVKDYLKSKKVVNMKESEFFNDAIPF